MTKTIRNDRMKTSENNNVVEQAIYKTVTDIYETFTPEQRRIIGQTSQLLAANGCPVTPDKIAIHLQASEDKVTSILRKFGAEFDQERNILGLGLSLVPTPHVY